MFVDLAHASKPPRTATPILRAGRTSAGVLNGRMAGTQHTPEPHPPGAAVARAADRALLETVEALGDEQLAAPSLLPGWTRTHVVAHLALNGEALADALDGVTDGRPVPMYASQAARDADIEELAAAAGDDVRRRLAEATARFVAAVDALPADLGETRIERVPGGSTFRAAMVPLMRWREVEIHHADLDAGYTRDHWSDEFAVALLDSMAHRPWPRPCLLEATDLGRRWEYGDPSAAPDDVPTVTGTARDLAWWATGRGAGEGLTTDHDTLPEVQEW